MTHVNWSVVGKVAYAIWAAVGPLIGVLIGSFLTSRTQRAHWLADNKKQEYRELLTVLSEAYTQLLHLSNFAPPTNDQVNRINFGVVDVIHNRIFTSDTVLVELDVFKTWSRAVGILRNPDPKGLQGLGGDQIKFSEMVGTLLQDIRAAALADIAK